MKIIYLCRHYDMIFLSGDMQTYDPEEWEDSVKLASAEEEIKTILTICETICPRVYFIPGNHDPPSLFISNEINPPTMITREQLGILI